MYAAEKNVYQTKCSYQCNGVMWYMNMLYKYTKVNCLHYKKKFQKLDHNCYH